MDLRWRASTRTRRVSRIRRSLLEPAKKTLIFFAVLVTLSIATWLFIPLLQGRDADFETRLALLQGRGADFVATPSEATPTPGTEPSEDPLPDHLDRVLLDHARTGEEGAGAKVAEAPPAPPADRPSPADMDSARAEQGYAQAQSNLGFMYDKRQGVPQDYAEAVGWYRKAAAQGYAKAQYNLGLMYENGEGVPQDYAQAHMWFNLAAAQGDEEAKNFRDDLAKRMTSEQIAEAQRLAREWKPK